MAWTGIDPLLASVAKRGSHPVGKPASAFSAQLLKRIFSRGLGRNALASLAQNLIGLGAFLITYRSLVGAVGLEAVGVWSLLMLGAVVGRAGDLSGGVALSKFVAHDVRDGNFTQAAVTTETVMLTAIAFNLVLGGLVMWLMPMVVPSLVATDQVAGATDLVVWVAGVLFATGIGTAVASAIDGAQRADLRSYVMAMSYVVLVAVALILIPGLGVVGFAIAMVAQQVFMAIVGWYVIRAIIPTVAAFPVRWSASRFRETFAFSVRINVISITLILFEPIVKLSFNTVDGPGAVALYELASRLVTQARGLFLALLAPVFPAFAATNGPGDPRFQTLLTGATRGALVGACVVVVASVTASPIVNWIVLDHASNKLLLICAGLSIGWGINLLCTPLYYAAQSQGILLWNFLTHLGMALVMLAVLAGAGRFVGWEPILLTLTGVLVLSAPFNYIANARALQVRDVLRPFTPAMLGVSAGIALIGGAAAYASIIF